MVSKGSLDLGLFNILRFSLFKYTGFKNSLFKKFKLSKNSNRNDNRNNITFPLTAKLRSILKNIFSRSKLSINSRFSRFSSSRFIRRSLLLSLFRDIPNLIYIPPPGGPSCG